MIKVGFIGYREIRQSWKFVYECKDLKGEQLREEVRGEYRPLNLSLANKKAVVIRFIVNDDWRHILQNAACETVTNMKICHEEAAISSIHHFEHYGIPLLYDLELCPRTYYLITSHVNYYTEASSIDIALVLDDQQHNRDYANLWKSSATFIQKFFAAELKDNAKKIGITSVSKIRNSGEYWEFRYLRCI